jgi:ribonuclease HII
MTVKQRKPQTASLKHERQYMEHGCRNIVGLDEAGRGAWAGPVSVGAVCLPLGSPDLNKVLIGVRDSKLLTPGQRVRLAERIKETAVAWGIGSATNVEIDEFGINPATRLAMRRALEAISTNSPTFTPDCLFLDSMPWPDAPVDCRLVSIVKGDRHSLTIAAASILAKVWRDKFMTEQEEHHPGYEFAAHKGYGTARHLGALKTLGVCSIHRRYYRPVQMVLSGEALE